MIFRSPASLPASDKLDGKLVGVPGAAAVAPKSCAGGLNGLAAGELVCARRAGNVLVTGVETPLAGAPKVNPPGPAPATVGGWPNGVFAGCAGALNGDEGAVCPNGCAVGGALPNEEPGGAPNVNGVPARAGSCGGVAPSLSISISSCRVGFFAGKAPNGAVGAAGAGVGAATEDVALNWNDADDEVGGGPAGVVEGTPPNVNGFAGVAAAAVLGLLNENAVGVPFVAAAPDLAVNGL